MRIILVKMFLLQFAVRMELSKTFPRLTLQYAKILIVVKRNVAHTVDLIRKVLHLALIAFNEFLQHLLGANGNFKMIDFFLKSL